MHTSFTEKLSPYQKAILHEMGIPLWRSKLIAEPEQEALEQLAVNNPPVVAEQAQTPPVLAIPNKLLWLGATEGLESRLLQDILLALNISTDDIVVAQPEQTLQQFTDYRLAWCFADKMQVDNNIMTTPAFEQLTSAEQKRRLWQLIQAFVINSDNDA